MAPLSCFRICQARESDLNDGQDIPYTPRAAAKAGNERLMLHLVRELKRQRGNAKKCTSWVSVPFGGSDWEADCFIEVGDLHLHNAEADGGLLNLPPGSFLTTKIGKIRVDQLAYMHVPSKVVVVGMEFHG